LGSAHNTAIPALTPGRPQEQAVRRWRKFAAPLIRFAFRPKLEGTEHLPTDRAVMIVANHSGLGLAEIMSLIVCLLDRYGTSLRIAPMVHPLSLTTWPTSGWMRRIGAIPATYEAANAALADGLSLLVFPGSDHESMRPIWQANRVDFKGRQGFLKIARAANVPIAPLGIRGSHYTLPIIYRSGPWLPRLLVLPYLMGARKRFPVTLAGALVVVALIAFGPIWTWWLTALIAMLVVGTPISQLPWIPWPIRMRFGPPIEPGQLFAGDGDLLPALERVQAAVQAQVRSRA
jgi:1-acyl-sn-glycerol-3-phosphate acyltransferase